MTDEEKKRLKWASKPRSCVCGHVHRVKNPEVVLQPTWESRDIIMEPHCWAYFVGSRCECTSFRPPVDPSYTHAKSYKPKERQGAPGTHDARNPKDRVHFPMNLPISDLMLRDPDFGTFQTMTLEQYHRLYPDTKDVA